MVRALQLLLNAFVVSSTPGIEQTGLLQTAKRDGLTRVAVHEKKWRTEEACRKVWLLFVEVSTGTCPPQVLENLRSGFTGESDRIKATIHDLHSSIADKTISISNAERDENSLQDDINAAIQRAADAREHITLLNQEIQQFNDLVEAQTTALNTPLFAVRHKMDQVEAAGERIVSWFKNDYQREAAVAQATDTVAQADDTASTGLLQTDPWTDLPTWTELWNSLHGFTCDAVEWLGDTCRSRVRAMRQACREAAQQLQSTANTLDDALETKERELQAALDLKGEAQARKLTEIDAADDVEERLAQLELEYEQSQAIETQKLQDLQERLDHLTGQMAAFGETFSPELFNALVNFGTASTASTPAEDTASTASTAAEE